MSALHPIPGMMYLQAVAPRHDKPSATNARTPLSASQRLRSLLQVALDVSFRIRPQSHLRRPGFGSTVRETLLSEPPPEVTGPVRVASLHLREDPAGLSDTAEVFGTAACAGRLFAFTGLARIAAPERLLEFRVLKKA